MSAVATKAEIKNLAARPGGGKTTTKRVAREKILPGVCSGTIFHVFRRFLIVFDKFSMGSSGVRSKDMNIYSFWIDLDVICSNLQEFDLVSWGSGTQIEKYDSRSKSETDQNLKFFVLTKSTVPEAQT